MSFNHLLRFRVNLFWKCLFTHKEGHEIISSKWAKTSNCIFFVLLREKESLINDVGTSDAHWAAETLKPLLGKENNSDYFCFLSWRYFICLVIAHKVLTPYHLPFRKIAQELWPQSDPWPWEVASYEGALLLQREEEGQEEGSNRKRHTGSDGRSLSRAVSKLRSHTHIQPRRLGAISCNCKPSY